MSSFDEMQKKYGTNPSGGTKGNAFNEMRKKYGTQVGEAVKLKTEGPNLATLEQWHSDAQSSSKPSAPSRPVASRSKVLTPKSQRGQALSGPAELPSEDPKTAAGIKAKHEAANYEEREKELEEIIHEMASWEVVMANVPKDQRPKTEFPYASVQEAEQALEQLRADRAASAGEYFHASGSEAVTALSTGKNAEAYVKAAEAYIALAELRKVSVSGGGLSPEESKRHGEMFQQHKEAVAQLKSAGFSENDIDKALKYALYMSRDEQSKKEAEMWQKEAENHPLLAAVAARAVGLVRGADFLSALAASVGHSNPDNLEQYRPLSTADLPYTNVASSLDAGVVKKIDDSIENDKLSAVAAFAYQTGASIADSALLAATLGPAATVVMGSGAAAQATLDAVNKGATNAQALTLGAFAGVFEALFEKVSIDNLLSPKAVTGGSRWFLETMKQAGIEASEEMATELANIFADVAVMGQNSDFTRAVRQYMADNTGMTLEEAKMKAALDCAMQVVLAGVGGALSGGVMGGVTNAVSLAREYAADKLTGKEYDTMVQRLEVLEVAMKAKPGSEVKNLASTIDAALRADPTGATVSETQWGRLIRATSGAVENGDIETSTAAERHDVVQAAHPGESVMVESAQLFMEQGDDAKTADTKSRILDRVQQGDTTLTDTELRKLDLNSVSTRAVFSGLGVEVPSTHATKDLIAFARSVVNETAKSVKAEEARAARLTETLAQPAQIAAATEAVQSAAHGAETTAPAAQPVSETLDQPAEESIQQARMEELTEQNADAAKQIMSEAVKQAEQGSAQVSSADTVLLTDGTTVPRQEYIDRYMQAHPNATKADAEAIFEMGQQMNSVYGQAAPNPDAAAPRTEIKNNPKDKKRRSVGAETNAQTKADESVSAAGAETDVRRYMVDYMNAVLPEGSPRIELADLETGENGFWDGEKNRIVLNSRKLQDVSSLVYYLGHEIVHEADSRTGRKMSESIAEFGKNWYGEETWSEMVQYKKQAYREFYADVLGWDSYRVIAETTSSKMEEEVCADMMRDMFYRADMLGRFAQERRPETRAVRNKVARLRDRIVGRIAGVGDALVEQTARKEMSAEVEQLLSQLDEALKSAGKSGTMGEEKPEQEVRRSAGREEESGRLGRNSPAGPDSGADGVEDEGYRPKFRTESRQQFEKRSRQSGKTVTKIGDVAYAYRLVPEDKWSDASRAAAETAHRLCDADVVVFSGNLEANADGVTQQASREAVTIGKKVIAFGNRMTYAPVDAAAHETAHLWMGQPAGQAYLDFVKEHFVNAAFEEELRGFYPAQKVDEEKVAYISGWMEGDQRNGWLSNYVDDPVAVRAEWEALKAENAPKKRWSVSRADTNTPEFRAWFHDDSGELTNPDGSPKELLRGSIHSGPTTFREGAANNSGGIFATTDQYAAENYAGRGAGMTPTEYKPTHYKKWGDAHLDSLTGAFGPQVSLDPEGPTWVFAIHTRNGWEVAGEYENNAAGLARFNAEFGALMRRYGAINPGFMRFYGSAQKTLVVDAAGRNWKNADNEGSKTDDVVARAWEDGYDCVVFNNVQDGGESIGFEFDEDDNYVAVQKPIQVVVFKNSSQVKSVYNTGTWDRNNPDVRYSVDPDFAKSIDEWDGESLKNFQVGTTSQVLRELGVLNRGVYLRSEKVKEILKKHPGMSRDVIKQLPDILENPIMVLNSRSAAPENRNRSSRVVMFGEVYDNGGAPVTAVVELRPTTEGGELQNFNLLVSAYGKNKNLHKMVEESEVLYLDPNKKRTDTWLQGVRLQLPSYATKYGSMGSITYDDGFVNISGTPWSKLTGSEVRRSVSPKKPKFGGNTGNVNPETGYERGSVADSFVRIWNTGDKGAAMSMLENTLSQLAQLQAEQAEQEKSAITAQVFRPKVDLTAERIAREQETIRKLIEKYGKMEQTSAAQQEVNLPKQIDDRTRVAGAAQTMQASSATNEVVRDQMIHDILSGEAGLTYNRVGDKATLNKVDEEYEKMGFSGMLKAWNEVSNGEKAPSKLDIARAEKLYVEACANKDVPAAMKLAAEIADAGTRAGQAVQAMTLLKRMTPAGQAYYIQRTVDRMNRDPKQKTPIKLDEALVLKLLEAQTRDEIDAAVDDLIQSVADQVPVTLADKWNTWRYFAMLGNPRTHIRNLVGNAIFTPARLAKDVIGTGLERVFLKEGQRTKSVTASKELRDFAKQDAVDMKSTLTNSGKYNPADQIRDRRTIFTKLRFLNTLTQKNSEWLEKEDWVFLRAAYQNSLAHFLAARNADVATLEDANSTPEGRALLEEARLYATNEAWKATYRDTSKIASTINHLKRNTGKVGAVLLEGILPFTKTPINIVKRGFEYSPLGLIKSLSIDLGKLKSGKLTASEVIDNVSAGMTGTGVALLGALLAHLGLLTGALGEDDEDEFKKLQGDQAYSLTIDGVGSYTIDWSAPVALPLFVGAEIYNALTGDYSDVEPDKILSAIADGMTSILEPMLSLSMLDGLNDALSANKYGDSSDAIYDVATTAATSYFSQGIPTILGQIARTLDPYRRTSFTQQGADKVKSTVSRFWQSAVQGKVPGYENEKMLYIDEWGRTDTTGPIALRVFENFLSPGYVNTDRTTDVDEELARLFKATKDNAVLPNRAQKYFSVGGENYAMTQEEYQAHLIDRGQTSYKLVNDLIHDASYDDLDDAEKAKAIALAYEYAAAMAKLRTNENYAGADKWMLKLADYEDKGGDAATYLMAKAKGVSATEAVASSDSYSVWDAADLLMFDVSATKTFADPYLSGNEYNLDAAQQEKYDALYLGHLREGLADLYEDSFYRTASAKEREEMISELKKEVSAQTKREMSDWLWDQGIESTPK